MKQSNVFRRFRVMETETILKNGSYTKSRTNSNNLLMSIQGGGRLTYSQMKNIVFLFTMILTLALVSCDKDPVDNMGKQETPLPKTEAEVFAQSEYNLALRDFTLVVGKAMKENAEFRKMLTNEAGKMITGEYSAIMNAIVDNPVDASCNYDLQLKSGNSTVRSLLKETHKQIVNADQHSISLKSSSVNDFIDEFLSQNPFLQITMPDEDEGWDENVMPIIAFIPEEDESAVYIPGYDSANDFEFVVLEDDILSDTPIILIDMNETLDLLIYGLGPEDRFFWPTGFDPIPVYNLIADLFSTGILDDGNGNPPQPNTEVPNPPTELSVEATTPNIKLKWKIPDQGNNNTVHGYVIKRQLSSENNFQPVGYVSPRATNVFNDATALPNLTYDYQVFASNEVGDSEGSNIIFATAPQPPPTLESFNVKVMNNHQIYVNWEANNSQAISSFELNKREWVPGQTIPGFSFLQSFGSMERDYMHNIGTGKHGKKIGYQMNLKFGDNASISKHDFIQMPYRNIGAPSQVRIKAAHIKHGVVKYRQGPPTICIRTMRVDPNNPNVGQEVTGQIFLKFTGSKKNKWDQTQQFDAFVTSWLPDNWYDTFTFYAVRTKKSGSWNLDFKVDYEIKTNLIEAVLGKFNVNDNLKISFSAKKGTDPNPEMGRSNLSYYEPYWKIIEFQNYEFKFQVGLE